MGDRVLMQCHANRERFGPVVYCHCSGSSAPEIVRALAERMQDRRNDVEYASARLVQAAIGTDRHSTGFGIWNAEHLLTKEDSHGDAGCVLIDVANNFSVEVFGGYLVKRKDGQIVDRDDEEED